MLGGLRCVDTITSSPLGVVVNFGGVPTPPAPASGWRTGDALSVFLLFLRDPKEMIGMADTCVIPAPWSLPLATGVRLDIVFDLLRTTLTGERWCTSLPRPSELSEMQVEAPEPLEDPTPTADRWRA